MFASLKNQNFKSFAFKTTYLLKKKRCWANGWPVSYAHFVHVFLAVSFCMCVPTCLGLYVRFYGFCPSTIFSNSWTSCQFIVGPHGTTTCKGQSKASCVGLWRVGGRGGGRLRTSNVSEEDIAICSSPPSGQEGKEQSVSDQRPLLCPWDKYCISIYYL